jgi:hypothetical protein
VPHEDVSSWVIYFAKTERLAKMFTHWSSFSYFSRAAEHGAEVALRFLLRHSHWSEAVELLQQLGADSPQHTSLFFLLLQHLIQVRVLFYRNLINISRMFGVFVCDLIVFVFFTNSATVRYLFLLLQPRMQQVQVIVNYFLFYLFVLCRDRLCRTMRQKCSRCYHRGKGKELVLFLSYHCLASFFFIEGINHRQD